MSKLLDCTSCNRTFIVEDLLPGLPWYMPLCPGCTKDTARLILENIDKELYGAIDR